MMSNRGIKAGLTVKAALGFINCLFFFVIMSYYTEKRNCLFLPVGLEVNTKFQFVEARELELESFR